MIPEIRDYQIDLIERLARTVAGGARIVVVQAATGAGKTTIAAAITKRAVAKGKKVFFLVHRRKLVNQICERLEDFQIDHGIIMRGELKNGSSSVQVASRDTLVSRCIDNQWIGLPQADIIFVDEGHHAWDEKSEYRRILAQYPHAKIFLLTATPVDPEGNGLGPWAQAIECAAPTSVLIEQGFLVPVKVYAPDRKTKHGKLRTRGIAGDLVSSWQEYAEEMPTVLFCSRVSHSLDAVAAFQASNIAACHIDAETEDSERDRIFDGLENGTVKVVSNVGIILEGVDVPALGCCQLFCEVGSRTRYLQSVGRTMRPSPGKDYAVVIDHSGATFKHGFADEDSVWPLNGNADTDFANKHRDGKTAKAFYCKPCQLAYHGQKNCPQCGRLPSKPPKSIFAPLPQKITNEILTEAERGIKIAEGREQMVNHWFLCLRRAAKTNGTVGMASMIYKRKYGVWPEASFPFPSSWKIAKQKVVDVYPELKKSG